MKRQQQAGILGATMLLCLSTVPVPRALGQVPDAPTTETAARPDKPSVQTYAPPEGNSAVQRSKKTGTGLLGRFVDDQRAIWSSPARLRLSDTEWLVPLSGITAGLFGTDRDFKKHLSHNPQTISHYKTLSHAGGAGLLGPGGGLVGVGPVSHNQAWA